MEKQNYKNHIRYYPPHHYVFIPAMLILIFLGIYKAYVFPVHRLEWSLLAVVSFFMLYLAIMFRQHYSLGNQDRIIRLEFRLRHFELLGKSSKEIERLLTFKQIAALRFSNDEEFVILLERVVRENLSPDDIKHCIQHWQPDDMRL